MSRTAEPCGCEHDGQRWLKMCEPHQVEHDATRAKWHAEYAARRRAVFLPSEPIPEFLQ